MAPAPQELGWSRDGRLLRRHEPEVRMRNGQSEVVAGGRVVFRGTGSFGQAEWSPDRHWVLVTWPTADQWVFVRAEGRRRIVGASRISAQFGGASHVAGWCCSG
jgi:hypothetical protein